MSRYRLEVRIDVNGIGADAIAVQIAAAITNTCREQELKHRRAEPGDVVAVRIWDLGLKPDE